jgi:cob(I)alamin adenosyltransferase
VKIYTKNGDLGKSSTPFGQIDKGHVYFRVLGGLDEITANLALVKYYVDQLQLTEISKQIDGIFDVLKTILDDLWYNSPTKQKFNLNQIEVLEKYIDEMDLVISPLGSFERPHGNIASLTVNVTRCVVRRVETNYFRLMRAMNMELDGGKYLNRLSDYLFTLYRYINKISNIDK